MAYASIAGRARTSASNPQAHAICDRCGFRYNHVDLSWQYDWRGASLQNTRILVCSTCMDAPQEQLRAIVVPADPTPITQARVQDFEQAETDYQTISQATVYDPITGIPIPSTTTLVTQNGQNLLTQQVGIPANLDQSAVMPLDGKTDYRVKLSPLSVTSTGTDQITVTFPAVHGLSTNDQIVVQGLANVHANGAYSITVTTATVFAYQTNTVIPAGSLLTGTTLMVTANIGMPYGFIQLPQTGV
jgi:hypothetical protein